MCERGFSVGELCGERCVYGSGGEGGFVAEGLGPSMREERGGGKGKEGGGGEKEGCKGW